MVKLVQAASSLDNLYRAWRDVRAQIQRTSWPEIAAEMTEVEAAPLRTLRRIRQQLQSGRYEFSRKWGYVKRKSGGSRRGITVHGVRDRIVQRSILNVIYTTDGDLQHCLGELPRVLQTPTSFAGAPGRGVPEAVAMAVNAMHAGARAVAYSDVKDFFPFVPRHDVVEFVKANVDDEGFVELFRAALETEIRNRDEVAPWLELFPTAEVGVAQGSLLSVLVGNLALRHFDVRLNQDPLVTIRYLDDFAIFGPSLAAVRDGFQAAQDELAKLGMTCYEPDDGSQKAALGVVESGFDFLGCRIHPSGLSPARRARRKLRREIAATIAEGKSQMRQFGKDTSRRRTEQAYAQTLVRIDKKVRGWGDAYRFVSNRLAFAQLDAEIDRMIDAFHSWSYRKWQVADARVRRRIQGVALLSDTPPRRPSVACSDNDGVGDE